MGGGPAGRRVHPSGVGAFAGAVERLGAEQPEAPAYRSPLLETQPGAVASGDHDRGIAGHYGDPLGEQQVLAADAGFVDGSNRIVLMLTGTDRMHWLDAVTSQDLAHLAGGRSAETLVLTPEGYVQHHMHVSNIGDTTWLNTEPGLGAGMLAHLDSRRYMLRVEVEEVSEDWAVTSVVGPGSAQALGAVGLLPPPDTYEVASLGGGGWLRRLPYPCGGSIDLTVPRRMLPHVAGRFVQAGVALAGVQAYEAMRIEALRPRVGRDTDRRTLPGEVGLLGVAARLDKHCYPGRFGVARAEERGEVRRRLVRLCLSGPAEDLPEHRTPVLLDGRRVGFVGSAAPHHALGPVALALVDAAVPRSAVLAVRGRDATVDGVTGGPSA